MNIKVSKETHDKIYDLIRSDEKKNLRTANDVIGFIFKQYEEKVRDKVSGIHNKDNFDNFLIQEIKMAFKEFDRNLSTIVRGVLILVDKR